MQLQRMNGDLSAALRPRSGTLQPPLTHYFTSHFSPYRSVDKSQYLFTFMPIYLH